MCDERRYIDMDGDSLAALYDSTITCLLDQQVPARVTTCRRRPSSLWFDDECCKAKRALRSQEKVLQLAGLLVDNTSPAATPWRDQRRQYLKLLHQKSSEFWMARIDAEQLQPCRLWRSFDQLLGRCRVSPSTDRDAAQLHRFFNDKVAAARAVIDERASTARKFVCPFS